MSTGVERLCKCGCGRDISHKRAGALTFDQSCRKRLSRARRAALWHVYPGDTLPVLVGAVALCGHVAGVETDRLIGSDDERCAVCVALLAESEAPR